MWDALTRYEVPCGHVRSSELSERGPEGPVKEDSLAENLTIKPRFALLSKSLYSERGHELTA